MTVFSLNKLNERKQYIALMGNVCCTTICLRFLYNFFPSNLFIFFKNNRFFTERKKYMQLAGYLGGRQEVLRERGTVNETESGTDGKQKMLCYVI